MVAINLEAPLLFSRVAETCAFPSLEAYVTIAVGARNVFSDKPEVALHDPLPTFHFRNGRLVSACAAFDKVDLATYLCFGPRV